MKVFKLNDIYNVVCENLPTRSGFKHTAHLLKNNYDIYNTKINYYNRTWECYEYESILIKVISSYFKDEDKNIFLNTIKNFR